MREFAKRVWRSFRELDLNKKIDSLYKVMSMVNIVVSYFFK